MLRFNPPELRDELATAIEAWKQRIDITEEYDFSEDIIDVTDSNFNPADYEDQTITYESEFNLGLPKWEDSARVTYEEFIALSFELAEANLIENRECWTKRRYLLRVSESNDQATRFLLHNLSEAESRAELDLQCEYLQVARESEALRSRVHEVFQADTDEYDEQFEEELWEPYREATGRRYQLLRELEKPTSRYCSVGVTLDDHEITCSLTEGFTVFGAAVAASGDYDKDLQPAMGDLFVEVRYSRPLSADTARYVAASYLFELSSSLDLEFEADARPTTLEDEELYSESERRVSAARLRPLLLGKGMPELLKLYNKAVAAADDEIRILYFAKVIEYVSQTVVRQQATEAIRTKLLSPRALNPDAEFVAELQAVVEEQRIFRKDREAMKQTMIACCDVSELSNAAPPFLTKLRSISSPSGSPRQAEDALAQLGYSLSATRNSVAHAKANYEPTGEECPEGQLAGFAECVKLAAQQTVRWYHARPEEMRVL